MLRRLHLLRPSGLACRYISSPLNVPQRPPYFRDETSPLYISEAHWNGLSPAARAAFSCDGVQEWDLLRERAFPPKTHKTDAKRNFGKIWLKPLEEAEVKNHMQQAPTLHGHPKGDIFLGGTVFWHIEASAPVKQRVTFVDDNTFEVRLKRVGEAVTPRDKTLWGYMKHDNDRRLAIVRGVSGSGKTVALLKHPAHAKVVTFYLSAKGLLQLNDTRRNAVQQPLSSFFTDRVTDMAAKQTRNEAAQEAVEKGVKTLLEGIAFSPDPSVNVLVAIDEAGNHPEFVRALCSCTADTLVKLRAFFGTDNVFIAVAGTGVETSTLAPGSENDRYKMLEPITPVWSRLCDCIAELKCVLPQDEKRDTRLHKLTRAFVGNARAAWALATVFTSRSAPKMTAKNTLATSALRDLCAEAARLLRQKNGLAKVSERSLPYLFVQAAFLQCQITPLVDDDFLLANEFGVLRDTATLISKNASTPQKALANGRELTAQEARLESPDDKAYVEEELRRFEMPATFTAWLHFSLEFGLQSPAGDGLEELTAQYAALALMARKASYFTPAYWSVVEKRMKRHMQAPWKVPFRLFDELSQLPGRDSLAAVEIFHLGKRFGPGNVYPTGKAVRAALGQKVALGKKMARHKVVINGPMAEFADVLVFPKGSQTLCLIQCKGSDKVNDGAGTRFTLRDLFTELYKMGCNDDMSCLAGCLNKAQRSSAPEWSTLHGVEDFAVAACIEAREFARAFALGKQMVAERALLKKCSAPQLAELQPLIAARNAADATLLKKLQDKPWQLRVSGVDFTDLASEKAHQGDAYDELKSALKAQKEALDALYHSTAAAGPLANALCAVQTFYSNPKNKDAIGKLLKKAHSRPAQTHPPFWRSVSLPNPSAELLEALSKALRYPPTANTKRFVLVWHRPVGAVPAWCVPQGCMLVEAKEWDGTMWPPTNLYPLTEQSSHDRCATMTGPADDTLKRSDKLLLP